MKNSYARRIGREEARLGRLAVSKSELAVFPAPGEPFTVHGDVEGELRVESYGCVCRGADKPHAHWYLPWPGGGAGNTVTFVRDGESSFAVSVSS